jgi:hypothetical protein
LNTYISEFVALFLAFTISIFPGRFISSFFILLAIWTFFILKKYMEIAWGRTLTMPKMLVKFFLRLQSRLNS